MRQPLVLLLLFSWAFPLQAETVRVAAAAGLQSVMQVILEDYRQQAGGQDVRITFGSSGVFAAQLQRGAPFDIFITADTRFAKPLVDQGRVRGQPYDFALGRLVFFSATELSADTATEAFEAWVNPHNTRQAIAIANPRHAPYGQAAVEWLSQHTRFDDLSLQVVQGENAAQTVQFVLSGAVSAGVVAWPLLARRDDLPGFAWLIPMDQHPPLRHQVLLLQQAGTEAQKLYEYLQQPQVQRRLVEYGFGFPD